MKRVAYLCLLFTLAAVGCASMGAFSPLLPVERSAIYQTVPNDATASLNDIFFTTDDGIKLHGRFFDCPKPKAVILYCHGNAGTVESWSLAASELQQSQQCAVLVFDYRGYGKSEGTPSEAGLFRDARTARRWLAKRTGVQEKDIVLLGRSLGGGVAVELAAKDGARGLILQNTFSSLPDVAAYHVPWLLPHWMMTQRFDSIEKIQHYRGPLLQCHGDKDRLIPIKLARNLFDEAPGEKHFITIPGGDHNDPPNDAYQKALREFLASLSAGNGSTSE